MAPDVHSVVREIIEGLNFDYMNPDQIICFRSKGTKSDAVHARCWSLPKIWQQALDVKPHYVIEVISEKYDSLTVEERKKLLIHELLHIPRTFRGGLRPHTGYINAKIVNGLYNELEKGKDRKDEFGIRFY